MKGNTNYMIRSKKDLMEYIKVDNNWLCLEGIKNRIIVSVVKYPSKSLKKFLYYLRKQEYYINTANGSKLKGLLNLYFERKKNKLGLKLGIEIGPNCFGKGLNLYHGGSIVINPSVRAGENCSLHGANCIGNNGLSKDVPHLGNNVDIGYGAILIGGITIADDIKIGANAVVNRSFTEPGVTIAGVPARVVKRPAQKGDNH